MKNYAGNINKCTAYPGEYKPLPEKEALFEKLIRHPLEHPAKPPLNLDEFEDYYKLEIMVPGANREDIFIYLQDNFLSIAVFHKGCDRLKKGKKQIHEYEVECLERNFLLPDNTDAAFIRAEYKEGILHLYLPKTDKPLNVTEKQVVVY